MRKLIKGVPQLSPSVVEPFDCDQPSPLRTKWGGKGELVLKRKIHSLEERVNNLEEHLQRLMEKKHHVVTMGGWEVHIVVDDDDHLNIDARHDDGTEVYDTGQCPGAGEDEGAIGYRLTTVGIEQKYKQEGNDND